MKQLHASGEDYLEAILVLKRKKGMVRSVDVARHLDVTCPHSSTARRKPEQGVVRPHMQWPQSQLTKIALRQLPRTARRKE